MKKDPRDNTNLQIDEDLELCHVCIELAPCFHVEAEKMVELADSNKDRRAEIYAAGDCLMGISLRAWLLEEVRKEKVQSFST